MAALSVGHAAAGRYGAAAKVVLGCVLADTLYCAVAVLGFTVVDGGEVERLRQFAIVGALCLALVGGCSFVRKKKMPDRFLFPLGFVSNLMQPKTVLMIAGLLSVLTVRHDAWALLWGAPSYLLGELLSWGVLLAGSVAVWNFAFGCKAGVAVTACVRGSSMKWGHRGIANPWQE